MTNRTNCSEQSFDHPSHGRQNCSVTCALARSKKQQVEFCERNCPDYFKYCRDNISTSSPYTPEEGKSSDLSSLAVTQFYEDDVFPPYWMIALIVLVCLILLAAIIMFVRLSRNKWTFDRYLLYKRVTHPVQVSTYQEELANAKHEAPAALQRVQEPLVTSHSDV